MKISAFTVTELQKIRFVCNFTPDELMLFDLRAKDITLEECSDRMSVSMSTITRLSRRIHAKIERVFAK